MANAEIFKTVFKGYSKEEVVAYIDNLNRQLIQLQDELSASTARLEQMEVQLENAEDSARNQVDEAALRESLIAELTPALSSQIRSKLQDELRLSLEKELRHEIEGELTPKYQEIIRTELNHRVSQQNGELQELRRRAQLYDDNREVLAELMIKAKNDAADIIHDAEEHARRLREDAEQRFQLLISDYERLKANLLTVKGESVDKLNAALRDLNEFERRFSCVDQDIAYSKAHLEEN